VKIGFSKRHRDVHVGDQRFFWLLRGISLAIVLLFCTMVFQIAHLSLPALSKFGLSFLFKADWNPVTDHFGAASFLYGTVVSSFLALLIAAPVSIGIALFLTELAPRRLAGILGFLVEMLAAIPSVVYGLWGIFVLAPLLRVYVQPFLGKHLGFLPFFQGPPYGVGMFSAGIILAIMIIPTISSICREVFSAVSLAGR
jgi:phosphate transport system permease protein